MWVSPLAGRLMAWAALTEVSALVATRLSTHAFAHVHELMPVCTARPLRMRSGRTISGCSCGALIFGPASSTHVLEVGRWSVAQVIWRKESGTYGCIISRSRIGEHEVELFRRHGRVRDHKVDAVYYRRMQCSVGGISSTCERVKRRVRGRRAGVPVNAGTKLALREGLHGRHRKKTLPGSKSSV